MAERHFLDLPNGKHLDVTAVPLQSFDAMRIQTHPNGFVLHFLRNEEPYPVCLGRFGVPRDGLVGLIIALVQIAQDAEIPIPSLDDRDANGEPPVH